ncbi:MAG: hypothetical protein CSA68_11055 [Rhodobacterales bacterium]|nr:MAG: hypothetical protein CSA68_11055 [Rhodobacterales bacterium]
MATAEKFPDALQCLSFEPGDEIISLAHLNTARFKTVMDLEICLQRVGNQLGDLSKVEPLLHAIGFARAGERPISYWLSAGRLGANAEEVAVYYARWRNWDSFIGRSFPVGIRNSWSQGFLAKNMDVILVIRRRDLRVLSVYVVMIFL